MISARKNEGANLRTLHGLHGGSALSRSRLPGGFPAGIEKITIPRRYV